jgi:hypothetical protein
VKGKRAPERSQLSEILRWVSSIRRLGSFRTQVWVLIVIFIGCVVRHYSLPAGHHAKLFLFFVASIVVIFIARLAGQKFLDSSK